MRLVLPIVLLLASSATALAQDERVRDQVRRLQQQAQKLQQDKARADAENAELKKKAEQVPELETKLKAADRAAGRETAARRKAEGEIDKLKAAATEQEKKLEDAEAQMADLRKTKAALEATIAERERQNKAMLASLQAERKNVLACEDKNLKLYRYGQEMVEKYRTKGVWDAVLQQGDGLTRIKDVEIYNVVQEYRDKLESEKIAPPGAAR